MKRKWEKVMITGHAFGEWQNCPYTWKTKKKKLAALIVRHMLPQLDSGIGLQSNAIHIEIAPGGVTAVLIPGEMCWICKTFYWEGKPWPVEREQEKTG